MAGRSNFSFPNGSMNVNGVLVTGAYSEGTHSAQRTRPQLTALRDFLRGGDDSKLLFYAGNFNRLLLIRGQREWLLLKESSARVNGAL